ncbi:hypothetical protein [Rubrivirga sp.]|uniref:hypothetical protein n=1 Tax=Rubrivirga sp. TaxID=1885344 RepID=UPI003C777620
MRRYDDPVAQNAFAPHLEDGEVLETWAYGVDVPRLATLVPLLAMRMTTHSLVGLTTRSVIVLEVEGRDADVLEVAAYGLEDRHPARINIHRHKAYLAIESREAGVPNEARPFYALFHWRGTADNVARVRRIADALGAREGKPGNGR